MTTTRGPRWRFRISLVSMIGGALTALAILVLLQQTGSVYPTRTVTLLAAVLGIAWGVAVPSVARTVGLRRTSR